jgi:hypothetical protein
MQLDWKTPPPIFWGGKPPRSYSTVLFVPRPTTLWVTQIGPRWHVRAAHGYLEPDSMSTEGSNGFDTADEAKRFAEQWCDTEGLWDNH